MFILLGGLVRILPLSTINVHIVELIDAVWKDTLLRVLGDKYKGLTLRQP